MSFCYRNKGKGGAEETQGIFTEKRMIGKGEVAVSYTHLDVYKRQQYIQSKSLKWKYISVIPTGYIEESVNQIRNVTLLVVTISILSVSYTHLDVYKRQVCGYTM